MNDPITAAAFGLLSAVALVGAAGAVVSREGRRVAFWLLVSMLGTCGAMLTLSSGYVSAAGLLVLAAAVPSMVLLLALCASPAAFPHRSRLIVSALVSVALGGTTVAALSTLPAVRASSSVPLSVASLGQTLFEGWPAAVPALAIVLLAALAASHLDERRAGEK